MRQYVFMCVLMTLFGLGTDPVRAEESSTQALGAFDQKAHADFLKRLSPEQVKVLTRSYPEFRLLKLCSGRFSGGDRDEVVLGLWTPVAATDQRQRQVHRVGLIWTGQAWAVHAIDDELEQDKAISRSFPLHWQYTINASGFSAGMKCGIEGEFTESSDLTYLLGDKPFFALDGDNRKPVCFATSDVYNNWDCVVFSRKDGRFRLWYQQAHAD